jgi:hypothetical protein
LVGRRGLAIETKGNRGEGGETISALTFIAGAGGIETGAGRNGLVNAPRRLLANSNNANDRKCQKEENKFRIEAGGLKR